MSKLQSQIDNLRYLGEIRRITPQKSRLEPANLPFEDGVTSGWKGDQVIAPTKCFMLGKLSSPK